MIHFTVKSLGQIVEFRKGVFRGLVFVRVVVKCSHHLLAEIVCVGKSIQFVFGNAIQIFPC